MKAARRSAMALAPAADGRARGLPGARQAQRPAVGMARRVFLDPTRCRGPASPGTRLVTGARHLRRAAPGNASAGDHAGGCAGSRAVSRSPPFQVGGSRKRAMKAARRSAMAVMPAAIRCRSSTCAALRSPPAGQWCE